MKEADGGLVRSMSRKLDTWKKCKELKIQLSDQFIASLVSLQETKDTEKAASEHTSLIAMLTYLSKYLS